MGTANGTSLGTASGTPPGTANGTPPVPLLALLTFLLAALAAALDAREFGAVERLLAIAREREGT